MPPAAAASFPTASFFRRMGALLVDWLICSLGVIAVVGWHDYSQPGSAAPATVLVVYIFESTLLTWLAGGSIGKLLTHLAVVPEDGRLYRLNPVKVLVRQVMIALVIPPLVFRQDGRGLHDLVAGTATVTFPTLRVLADG